MTLHEYFEKLRGKRVLVLGLGVSNRPLVRLLLQYGAGATLITGNIDFYGKSGFVPASKFGIRYSDADPDDKEVIYFLAKELKEGYLAGANGTYKDPEGYFVCQNLPKEFEEFDKRF